ncbi:GGDEF domain-containing protein [Aquibium sp. LZ166]|uniref:GGDEF domain-containing protein n=1 Tax=Aquibium pacificus TaxID=3153579 RepID=A0ABV3SDA9_9HYPH
MPEVRERLIRSVFERRAVVVFGAVTSTVSAITAAILTDASWPYLWLIAEAILFVARMRGLVAVDNSSPQQAERCYAILFFLGITWGTVFGLGSYGLISTGDPLLVVLAAINVAGAVGNIASRNAPLPRFGALVMAATCIPFATALLVHGPSEMWIALLMGPVWVAGMVIVMLQNHDMTVRMIVAELENHRIARTDRLTDLPNRISLEERLAELCSAIGTSGSEDSFAILCLDLDDFKPVNDEYGHAVGDKLLGAAARRIRNSIREVDSAYRLGGDEFVVLLPGTARAEAVFVGSRIITALTRPFDVGAGELVRIGASIGSTVADAPNVDPQALLDRADQALYAAKAAGKNVYRDSHTGAGG